MKKINGTVIIYVSNECDHCLEIIDNENTIREILLSFFENVSIRNIENNLEFLAYGFDGVPVCIFPGYRPFESIDPSFIMKEDTIKQMIDGFLLPEDCYHEKKEGRIQSGLTFNKNINYLTGKIVK